MIQEAYCSYEVSKLLKEKGFSWECRTCYEHGELKTDVCRQYTDWNSRNEVWELMSAPTHQMACAWLREEKNIHIDIYYLPIHRKYMWSIVETKDPKGAGSKELYEEAVEAALKYTLENLL